MKNIREPRGSESNLKDERRAIVLGALVAVGGICAVGVVGKMVWDRFVEVMGSIDFTPEVQDATLEDMEEADIGAPVEGTRIEVEKRIEKVAMIVANEEGAEKALEAAHELIYAVEMACAENGGEILEYDEFSRAERDNCNLLPQQSEYSLCIEDVREAFCMVEDPDLAMDKPLFHCMDYNHGSPREACMDELVQATKERAFYECRDRELEERDIAEEYHLAQVKVFENNMKYIGGLKEKLENDPNYQPKSSELMEYFNAYNQLKGLRDFDVVLDQLDLGVRTDFVQIYGREMKDVILERGCSDEEADLDRMLEEFLPT